jgi:methoxymalonate biosynthesis acyl carrier protein
MTVDRTDVTVTAAAVEGELLAFIRDRTKATVGPDDDLFRTGHVSSMFAMQLVVHLEETHDIAIIGPDLKLDNFRTVARMTALVLRLRGSAVGAADV